MPIQAKFVRQWNLDFKLDDVPLPIQISADTAVEFSATLSLDLQFGFDENSGKVSPQSISLICGGLLQSHTP